MNEAETTVEEYTAAELKALAIKWLLSEYPDAHVVEEFSIAQWGGALIDVAAITPHEIVGVEVKGKGDSPARLKLQGAMYSQVCTRVYLLATPDLEAMFKRNHHKPDAWDWLTVKDGVLENELYHRDRTSGLGPKNCAGRMLEVLWKDELIKASRSLGIKAYVKSSKSFIAHQVAETVPLDKIRKAVVKQLRTRKWIAKTIHKAQVQP